MPKDKLDQWSENDHQEASTYTQDQGQQYQKQGNPHSQPGRQHVDSADQSKPEAYRANVKPVQPPCDGMQFAENPYMQGDNYLAVSYDQWNNERPKDMPMHTSGEYGDPGSIYGGRSGQDFNFTSGQTYGNQIPHGQSAAFNTASTVYVDNSAANRGPEFVEGSDSGMVGNGRSSYDSNSVAQGNTPPIISYLNSKGRK